MQKQSRRFELLLPTKFNNGEQVPGELVADTLLELEEQFGAVSSETQKIIGRWRHQGQIYRDLSIRVFVDVTDTPENRQFFVDFKERLKERFQQLDIWMTTYLVEVI
ncbi:MAG TPA: hypothetical protein VMJ32_15790 [Pirellulales bacterium]|nr:hypothetical protein [Pirellulales bacterium]